MPAEYARLELTCQGSLASDALVGIFRKAEDGYRARQVRFPQNASERKDCQMTHAQNDHTARASNEGRCS
jgi:hypothetical protein